MRNELINFSFNLELLKHFEALAEIGNSKNPVIRVTKSEDRILFKICGHCKDLARYIDLGCVLYDFSIDFFSFSYGRDEEKSLDAAVQILERNRFEISRVLNIKVNFEQLCLF